MERLLRAAGALDMPVVAGAVEQTLVTLGREISSSECDALSQESVDGVSLQ